MRFSIIEDQELSAVYQSYSNLSKREGYSRAVKACKNRTDASDEDQQGGVKGP